MYEIKIFIVFIFQKVHDCRKETTVSAKKRRIYEINCRENHSMHNEILTQTGYFASFFLVFLFVNYNFDQFSFKEAEQIKLK